MEIARQRCIRYTTTRPSKKRWNHRVLLLHLWGCRETSVLHARFPHLPLGTRGYSGIFLILTYQGTEANTYTNKQALSPATNAMKNLLPPGRLEPETLQLPGRGVSTVLPHDPVKRDGTTGYFCYPRVPWGRWGKRAWNTKVSWQSHMCKRRTLWFHHLLLGRVVVQWIHLCLAIARSQV